MKKCISVLLYLGLVVAFLGFDIKKLFDLKQMLLVVIGAVILYIPSLKTGDKFKIDKELAGQNALWASIIQTFVLFYNMLATNYAWEERFLNTALSCRPLLYGFCIWVILHNDEGQEEIKSEDIGIDTEIDTEVNTGVNIGINTGMNTGMNEANGILNKAGDKDKEDEDNISEIQSEKIKETAMVQKNDKQQDENIIYKEDSVVKNILPGIEECRQQFLDAGLTRREAEVALLVIKCMSNAEIAEELYISETTVKKHMSNIFAKLKISKREQVRNLLH